MKKHAHNLIVKGIVFLFLFFACDKIIAQQRIQYNQYTQQSYLQNLRSMGEIQAQLRQLGSDKTKTEREYLDNLRSTSDIQGQLQELDTKEKRLSQESFETNR